MINEVIQQTVPTLKNTLPSVPTLPTVPTSQLPTVQNSTPMLPRIGVTSNGYNKQLLKGSLFSPDDTEVNSVLDLAQGVVRYDDLQNPKATTAKEHLSKYLGHVADTNTLANSLLGRPSLPLKLYARVAKEGPKETLQYYKDKTEFFLRNAKRLLDGTVIDPVTNIIDGDTRGWKQLVHNNVYNATETLDILSRYVKALMPAEITTAKQYGLNTVKDRFKAIDGYIDAQGYYHTRTTYDYDVDFDGDGNRTRPNFWETATDIALEMISDPMDWITSGASEGAQLIEGITRVKNASPITKAVLNNHKLETYFNIIRPMVERNPDQIYAGLKRMSNLAERDADIAKYIDNFGKAEKAFKDTSRNIDNIVRKEGAAKAEQLLQESFEAYQKATTEYTQASNIMRAFNTQLAEDTARTIKMFDYSANFALDKTIIGSTDALYNSIKYNPSRLLRTTDKIAHGVYAFGRELEKATFLAAGMPVFTPLITALKHTGPIASYLKNRFYDAMKNPIDPLDRTSYVKYADAVEEVQLLAKAHNLSEGFEDITRNEAIKFVQQTFGEDIYQDLVTISGIQNQIIDAIKLAPGSAVGSKALADKLTEIIQTKSMGKYSTLAEYVDSVSALLEAHPDLADYVPNASGLTSLLKASSEIAEEHDVVSVMKEAFSNIHAKYFGSPDDPYMMPEFVLFRNDCFLLKHALTSPEANATINEFVEQTFKDLNNLNEQLSNYTGRTVVSKTSLDEAYNAVKSSVDLNNPAIDYASLDKIGYSLEEVYALFSKEINELNQLSTDLAKTASMFKKEVQDYSVSSFEDDTAVIHSIATDSEAIVNITKMPNPRFEYIDINVATLDTINSVITDFTKALTESPVFKLITDVVYYTDPTAPIAESRDILKKYASELPWLDLLTKPLFEEAYRFSSNEEAKLLVQELGAALTDLQTFVTDAVYGSSDRTVIAKYMELKDDALSGISEAFNILNRFNEKYFNVIANLDPANSYYQVIQRGNNISKQLMYGKVGQLLTNVLDTKGWLYQNYFGADAINAHPELAESLMTIKELALTYELQKGLDAESATLFRPFVRTAFENTLEDMGKRDATDFATEEGIFDFMSALDKSASFLQYKGHIPANLNGSLSLDSHREALRKGDISFDAVLDVMSEGNPIAYGMFQNGILNIAHNALWDTITTVAVWGYYDFESFKYAWDNCLTDPTVDRLFFDTEATNLSRLGANEIVEIGYVTLSDLRTKTPAELQRTNFFSVKRIHPEDIMATQEALDVQGGYEVFLKAHTSKNAIEILEKDILESFGEVIDRFQGTCMGYNSAAFDNDVIAQAFLKNGLTSPKYARITQALYKGQDVLSTVKKAYKVDGLTPTDLTAVKYHLKHRAEVLGEDRKLLSLGPGRLAIAARTLVSKLKDKSSVVHDTYLRDFAQDLYTALSTERLDLNNFILKDFLKNGEADPWVFIRDNWESFLPNTPRPKTLKELQAVWTKANLPAPKSIVSLIVNTKDFHLKKIYDMASRNYLDEVKLKETTPPINTLYAFQKNVERIKYYAQEYFTAQHIDYIRNTLKITPKMAMDIINEILAYHTDVTDWRYYLKVDSKSAYTVYATWFHLLRKATPGDREHFFTYEMDMIALQKFCKCVDELDNFNNFDYDPTLINKDMSQIALLSATRSIREAMERLIEPDRIIANSPYAKATDMAMQLCYDLEHKIFNDYHNKAIVNTINSYIAEIQNEDTMQILKSFLPSDESPAALSLSAESIYTHMASTRNYTITFSVARSTYWNIEYARTAKQLLDVLPKLADYGLEYNLDAYQRVTIALNKNWYLAPVAYEDSLPTHFKVGKFDDTVTSKILPLQLTSEVRKWNLKERLIENKVMSEADAIQVQETLDRIFESMYYLGSLGYDLTLTQGAYGISDYIQATKAFNPDKVLTGKALQTMHNFDMPALKYHSLVLQNPVVPTGRNGLIGLCSQMKYICNNADRALVYAVATLNFNKRNVFSENGMFGRFIKTEDDIRTFIKVLHDMPEFSTYILAPDKRTAFGFKIVKYPVNTVEDFHNMLKHQYLIASETEVTDMLNVVNNYEVHKNFIEKYLSTRKQLDAAGDLFKCNTALGNLYDALMKASVSTGIPGVVFVNKLFELIPVIHSYDKVKKLFEKYLKQTCEGTLADIQKFYKEVPAASKIMPIEDFTEMYYIAINPIIGDNFIKSIFSEESLGKQAFQKAKEFAYMPMSVTERYARITIYKVLSDIGFSESQIYAYIRKTQFDYSNKARSTRYLEFVFPYLTYIANNTNYWLNVFSSNYTVTRHLLDLQWYASKSFTDGVNEAMYNQGLLYHIFNGNLQISDEGLVLKLNRSYMDAFNLLFDPVDGVINATSNRLRTGVAKSAAASLLLPGIFEDDVTASRRLKELAKLYAGDPNMYPILNSINQRFLAKDKPDTRANEASTGRKNYTRLKKKQAPIQAEIGFAFPSVFGSVTQWERYRRDYPYTSRRIHDGYHEYYRLSKYVRRSRTYNYYNPVRRYTGFHTKHSKAYWYAIRVMNAPAMYRWAVTYY